MDGRGGTVVRDEAMGRMPDGTGGGMMVVVLMMMAEVLAMDRLAHQGEITHHKDRGQYSRPRSEPSPLDLKRFHVD
jgi:hypothetical protein